MTGKPTVHGSAVLVGERAVLIRGPSGSGKSRLAFELILAGRAGQVPPAILVGDDRVHLDTSTGNLVVRPAPELAGLIEIRGLGIRRIEHVEQAVVGLIVDLDAEDADRLPAAEALTTGIDGVELPRIPVNLRFSPLPLIVAALTTTDGTGYDQPSADCPKGIANHISPTIATE
ncbi:HPr kinase/phosphatase C-terminal domain-containing protein [Bradyrhizobium sp.]|uniref:HPr kinase/phosphorylase n=1 Tax=Bradyrhizobium sp. TaxID=376 RepID=UPI001D65BE50|nr:HPr kinase/phosphatase C-terminal domain-containing protein [Bradyrhizobium sp.]MBI5320127.1 HPr kinase/phosphatase C-terminal domain-containing protein [Bradyrhizobium sp.]